MAQERYRASSNPRKNKTPAGGRTPSEEAKKRAAQRREEQRKQRERAAEIKRLRRARQRALFGISLIVAVVFVALYWVWVVFSIVNRSDGSEEALPILVYTQGEKEEDSRLEKEEVYFNGSYYLPVTCLEPYMAITQFGDWDTRSVLLCDSGEYATFYLDSANAVINGQRVSIKNDSFLMDDVLYLPIDFYTDKMNCFTFAESVPLAANVLTFQTETDPAFRFRENDPVAEIDPATIPVLPTPSTDPDADVAP